MTPKLSFETNEAMHQMLLDLDIDVAGGWHIGGELPPKLEKIIRAAEAAPDPRAAVASFTFDGDDASLAIHRVLKEKSAANLVFYGVTALDRLYRRFGSDSSVAFYLYAHVHEGVGATLHAAFDAEAEEARTGDLSKYVMDGVLRFTGVIEPKAKKKPTVAKQLAKKPAAKKAIAAKKPAAKKALATKKPAAKKALAMKKPAAKKKRAR